MNQIPEAPTLQEGFNWGTAFVVRKLNLPCDLTICEELAEQTDVDLFGYAKGGSELWTKASEAFAIFKAGTLTLNIVDAPFPVLLDHELPELLLQLVKQSRKKICLTLTRKGSYPPLHVDPNHGGGWMYLQQGIKKWQVMTVGPEKFNPTMEGNLQDPPLELDADYILESTIRAGDFLYFPALSPHRVWTYDNSFGVSGYAKL